MSDYLTWKIETNVESGGAQDALAYKWCRSIEDDNTRRADLSKRIDELHRQTYVSPAHDEVN